MVSYFKTGGGQIKNQTRRSSRGEEDGGIAWVRGRKNNFVREKRTPRAGGGVVVCCAADEFVPAILVSDEASGAKRGDELAACAMEKAET